MTETHRQYKSRRIRERLQEAKVAVMEVQQELQDFRGVAAEMVSLADAAFRRLDNAWTIAARIERHERDKAARAVQAEEPQS